MLTPGHVSKCIVWDYPKLSELASVVLEAMLPDRALCFPTFSQFLIVSKNSLSAVPVGPPRPSSITHPEVSPATVTCSYIVGLKWILGWGNLVHDTTTTMPGPCSEKSASSQEGWGRRRRSAVWNTWAGWGSIPVVFPPGMAGHPCLILRARSLSLQGDPANIGKG